MTWGKSDMILSASQVIPIEGCITALILCAHESSLEIQRPMFKKGEFYLKQLQRRAMRERDDLKRNQNFLGFSILR